MRRPFAVALGVLSIAVVLPAQAAAQGRSETAPNCEKGISTAAQAGNKSEQAQQALARQLARCGVTP